ncbi:MAG: hypothetical protein RPU34_07030 [Candidatus Sedimenticola sp. (ex Thyasira tokunagai)]
MNKKTFDSTGGTVTTEPVAAANIEASGGSVSIGVAKDGSQITVNNIQVGEAVIRQLAHPPGRDAEQVTCSYLEYIESYYGLLKLKGMGNNSGLRLNFPLIELFVPLNARLSIPEADRLSDELRVAGRRLQVEELHELQGGFDQPQPVLWLIQDHPVLVILGDPGSGKSTVLTLLALLLATGQGKVLGLDGYLPLLLPLSAYSAQLEKIRVSPCMISLWAISNSAWMQPTLGRCLSTCSSGGGW